MRVDRGGLTKVSGENQMGEEDRRFTSGRDNKDILAIS